LPGWCDAPELTLNGSPVDPIERSRGYASLRRTWKRGDVVSLKLPMPIQRIKSHPKVAANVGRVALQRGPLIYCLEAADNDGQVRNRVLPPDAILAAKHRPDLLGGITLIEGPSETLAREKWPDLLYQASASAVATAKSNLMAIPYFANSNRQAGDMQVWIAESRMAAEPRPIPTIASRAIPTTSHCWRNDTVAALNDQIDPAASDDTTIPRFTWWDHRGTNEWVQYDFDDSQDVSAVEVYWWDERRINAHCRVPESWRLLYLSDGEWKAVTGVSSYGVEMDQFNHVTFDKVRANGLRIEIQCQPEWSSGILEWRLE
jgi:hypothetical protein